MMTVKAKINLLSQFYFYLYNYLILSEASSNKKFQMVVHFEN